MLPNLEAYLRLLEPEMQFEKQKNEVKRHEAWRVYGALMVACLHDPSIFLYHFVNLFLCDVL